MNRLTGFIEVQRRSDGQLLRPKLIKTVWQSGKRPRVSGVAEKKHAWTHARPEPLLAWMLLLQYHEKFNTGKSLGDFLAGPPKLKKIEMFAEQLHGCDKKRSGWLYTAFSVPANGSLKNYFQYRRGKRPFVLPQTQLAISLIYADTQNGVEDEQLEILLDQLGVEVPQHRRTVSLSELGPFLAGFREDRSLPAVCKGLELPLPLGIPSLEAFEAGEVSGSASVDALRKIMEAYKADRIMVDWLAARPCEDICSETISGFGNNQIFESGCVYRFPENRLARVPVALVAVDLPDPHGTISAPGPSSDADATEADRQLIVPRSHQHWHPGDELIFILDGAVELRLPGGFCQRLEKYDYALFEAEQEHVLLNHGRGDAKVFVVRFYPRREHSTRRFVGKVLLDSVTGGQVDDSRKILLKHYVRQMIQTQVRYSDEGIGEVKDFVSLLRRIDLFLPLAGLTKAAFNSKVNRLNSADQQLITSLLDGNSRSIEGLESLRRVLGTKRILLDDVLSTTFPQVVIVRNEHDWLEPPPFDESLHQYTRYYVPRHSLFGTDVAINKLELTGAGGSSPWNRHPGSELIYCLEGQIRVRHGREKNRNRQIVARAGDYVHYESQTEHIVENAWNGKSLILIIRFYDAPIGVDPYDARPLRGSRRRDSE